MKGLKRMIALLVAVAIAGLSSHSAVAQEYYASNTGGYGYQESRQSGYLAPAIALGTIALVAIIAVALQDSHGGHGHHSH